MVDVWEMEVRRARTWLGARQRAASEHRRDVFRRVNSHMNFVDHQRALRSSQEDDAEDLGALDFLSDVNAEDMSALLQAEVMASVGEYNGSTASVATVAAVSTVTAVDASLKPIEMPPHLVTSPPKKTPQRYGGGATEAAARTTEATRGTVTKPLSSTPAVAPTTIGMSFSSDDNVKELMADLQLEVHAHSDAEEEERKTEESTPPHSSGLQALSISATKDKMRRPGFAAAPNGSRAEEVRGQNPQKQPGVSSNSDAAKNKSTNPVNPDSVTSEMLSWVSGMRDPTVLQRKESLAKRNRKRVRHFGIGSAEEQRYVQEKVKYFTQDSDSDDVSSEGDNDYSPSEDPFDFEPEEPVDKDEMLSDDYLNSDAETFSKKRKRLKRLKKAPSTKRTAKPIDRGGKPVPKDKTSDANRASSAEARRSDVENGQRSEKLDPQPVNHANGATAATIDLRSSDDDEKLAEGVQLPPSTRTDGSASSVNGKDSTVLRRKVSDSLRNQDEKSTQDKPTTVQDASAAFGEATTANDEGYETPELPSDSDESDKENSSANASASNVESVAPIGHPAVEAADGDGEVSDTGTVDYDFDNVEASEDQQPSNSADQLPSDNNANVSDAETVVLDDEPASDDLGLNYSDDSDNVADPDDVQEEAEPTSVPGVQQFFDFKPLKLKPKKAVATRKMVPVHPEVDFVKAKKSTEVSPSKEVTSQSNDGASAGSNGLRPTKARSLNTLVTMKGKHPVVRRSIKVLDRVQPPTRASNSGAARQASERPTREAIDQRYSAVDRPTGSNGLRKSTTSVHRSEASDSQDAADGESSARYLSYSGSSASGTNGTTKSAPAKPTPIVAPSRYGGGGELSGGAALHSATNGSKGGQFRRDPQISLYDALHIEGKEEDRSFMDRDAGYKRPTAFKKLQAEAARTGVALVTSKEKEPDYDKMPIPKKGIAFTSGVPEPRPKPTESASRSKKKSEKKPEKPAPSHQASRYGGGGNYSSRSKSSKEYGNSDRGGKKQRGRQSDGTTRPFYYGPSSEDATSRSDWHRSRSSSPPRYKNKRYEDKESRGGDWKRRGSSRSPSPRSRDHGRDRDRTSYNHKSTWQRAKRSPSPDQGRSRSNDRDTYRSEKNSRKRSASPSRSDKKHSVSYRDSDDRDFGKSKKHKSAEMSGSYRDSDDCDFGKSKKQKSAETSRVDTVNSRQQRSNSPQSGALANFDDDEGLYISESEPEIDMEMEKQEDIRFDLETVAVDPALMARRVYVTGFNPAICGEDLEEIFAPFDVETDRETGYPAIDVFTCQRTFKSRGDACVTFLTEKGAADAVEELNAKHVKSSLIGVRLMDVHTQRILNAQFEVVRDTWKCSGTRCRAEVSTWDNSCPQCRRKRCFGPSHLKITRDSWLCSICFTANDKYDNDCKGCGESLPETGRFSSYRS